MPVQAPTDSSAFPIRRKAKAVGDRRVRCHLRPTACLPVRESVVPASVYLASRDHPGVPILGQRITYPGSQPESGSPTNLRDDGLLPSYRVRIRSCYFVDQLGVEPMCCADRDRPVPRRSRHADPCTLPLSGRDSNRATHPTGATRTTALPLSYQTIALPTAPPHLCGQPLPLQVDLPRLAGVAVLGAVDPPNLAVRLADARFHRTHPSHHSSSRWRNSPLHSRNAILYLHCGQLTPHSRICRPSGSRVTDASLRAGAPDGGSTHLVGRLFASPGNAPGCGWYPSQGSNLRRAD